jgi:Integrase zinc binding domain
MIYVGTAYNWPQVILKEVHDELKGHLGMNVTYHHLKQLFFLFQMKEDIIIYVKSCYNYQMVKPKHIRTLELLRPLPISDAT